LALARRRLECFVGLLGCNDFSMFRPLTRARLGRGWRQPARDVETLRRPDQSTTTEKKII